MHDLPRIPFIDKTPKEAEVNPFEGEVCRNGHKRTLKNTRMYNRKPSMRIILVCQDCYRVGTKRKPRPGLKSWEGTKCINGHPQSKSNIYVSWDSAKKNWKKQCKKCSKVVNGRGSKYLMTIKKQDSEYRIEDVEDLLDFGEKFTDIIFRAGYASWDSLHKSLKRRDRYDLIEKMNLRREQE